MDLDNLGDEELLRLLVKHRPEKYGHLGDLVLPQPHTRRTHKKRRTDDVPNLSGLPAGQRRAVNALIGGGMARTYLEAAEQAGVSLGTLKTHLRRVRQNHSRLYEEVRKVRSAQLAERHEAALVNARQHSKAYFRRKGNRRFYLKHGYYPWQRRG